MTQAKTQPKTRTNKQPTPKPNPEQSLAGKRIVITRPEAQSTEFVAMLREAGAQPIMFPTIQIAPIPNNEPLTAALSNLANYDWVVFTSVNGVNAVFDQFKDAPRFDGQRVAAIGPATAAALHEHGVQVDLQPGEYVAEVLFEALRAHGSLKGQRFLLLRADIARAALREQLLAHGAQVNEIPVYRTVCGDPPPAAFAELRAGVDVITFTSSSTVRYFFELLGADTLAVAERALIACIGPVTAGTAQELGLRVNLVADEYTIPGLVHALTEKLTL